MSIDSLAISLKKRKHEIVFQALMNVIYHENFEKKFSKLLDWTAFFSIIFSSATFIIIFGLVPETLAFIDKKVIFAMLAFSVTCLNSIVLAFGITHKMVLHRDLKKKWLGLYGEANHTTECEEGIKKIEREYYYLNTLEPPANKKQLKLAYEDTCLKMGLK